MFRMTSSHSLLALVTVSMAFVFIAGACAQGVPERQTAGGGPDDIDLSPPANGTAAKSPAPPAKIDVPDASETQNSTGDEASSDVQPIPDGERTVLGGDNAASQPPSLVSAPNGPPLLTTEQRLARMEKQLDKQQRAIQALADTLPSDERLAKIEKQLDELRASFNLVAKQFGDGAIVSPDAPPREASQRRGTLVVTNRTGVTYTMTVNGYPFTIGPGERRINNVPVADVVTELTGYEAARRWQAANWQQVDGADQLSLQIN